MKKEDRPIKMLIADDHQMVREGIRMMLESKKSSITFELDEAETAQEAIQKAARQQFDIILMDYDLPSTPGSESVAAILKNSPTTRILAISNYDELAYVEEMLDAGAKGYILKNIEAGQLVVAIRTILEDKPYFSSEVATKMLRAEKKIMPPSKKRHDLTPREIEVLKCIATEMTNEQIAERLFISKRTVDTHRQNLMTKLSAQNTVGLIKAAYLLKLV